MLYLLFAAFWCLIPVISPSLPAGLRYIDITERPALDVWSSRRSEQGMPRWRSARHQMVGRPPGRWRGGFGVCNIHGAACAVHAAGQRRRRGARGGRNWSRIDGAIILIGYGRGRVAPVIGLESGKLRRCQGVQNTSFSLKEKEPLCCRECGVTAAVV